MPTESVTQTSLEHEIRLLIGDHILEIDDAFGFDENLFDSGLDSMAIMQLLLLIEEHLDVEIAIGEVTKENFRSARSIAQLVREKSGSAENEQIPSEPFEPAPLPEPAPVDDRPAPFSDFAYPETKHLANLTESDCFVRANERVMKKSGQGLHIVNSILDLESQPDIEKLQSAMRILMERHPILGARYSKGMFSTPAFEREASLATEIPLEICYETGARAVTKEWGAQPVGSARERLEALTSLPSSEFQKNGRCHVRCNLIEKRDGTFLFVLTWRHIIFDGVGAELFCQEIDHAASGKSGMLTDALDPPASPAPPIKERLARARPMVNFFNTSDNQGFRSLAGPNPKKGSMRFEVLELDADQSQRVFERREQMGGPVVTTPFHAACAVRAHEMVWRSRQRNNVRYMVTVPIQTRRKGSLGPIFQNHLTMLFLSARPEESSSIDKLVETLQRQQERFLKDKLGNSFQEMQRLMRYLPPWLYTAFIRWHMRGEMTSFFFSGTGTFAPEMSSFAGARIRNAYHVPSVSRPPGTGLFINDKNGLVTTVLSYREGVISPDEALLLRDGFVEGLTGEWPNEKTRSLRNRIRLDEEDDV